MPMFLNETLSQVPRSLLIASEVFPVASVTRRGDATSPWEQESETTR